MFSNGANDLIRYYKYGFSKVSDHVARDIRLKRLTIETGKKYILNYSTKIPTDIHLLCDWLGISESKFYNIINKFRNKNYFKNNSLESEYLINLKKINLNDFKNYRLIKKDKDILYRLTNNREKIKNDRLIMIGRAYNDKYNYGAIEDQPNKQNTSI